MGFYYAYWQPRVGTVQFLHEVIRKRQTHGIHVVCLFMQNFYQIRALEKEYTTNLPKNSLGWVIDGRSMYWTVRFLMSGTVFPL